MHYIDKIIKHKQKCLLVRHLKFLGLSHNYYIKGYVLLYPIFIYREITHTYGKIELGRCGSSSTYYSISNQKNSYSAFSTRWDWNAPVLSTLTMLLKPILKITINDINLGYPCIKELLWCLPAFKNNKNHAPRNRMELSIKWSN